MTRFTVVGGRGFVGSHLVRRLRAEGHDCEVPERGADLGGRDLGIVIYAAGVTADFRRRPLDAIEAHVTSFIDVVKRARYDTMLYLSSTRVYRYGNGTTEEATIVVRPSEADDVYAISKCMGESVALTIARDCRVARLSNVYGPDVKSDNFLSSITRDAVRDKHVLLHSTLDSAKDYIGVDEVCELLIRIALSGRERVYNVASGISTTHREIANEIARLTGATFDVAADAAVVRDAPIDVRRVQGELDFAAAPLTQRLGEVVAAFQQDAERHGR